MKISLGIDFNPIRTIVCYYDEQNSMIKTLYNQPSVGILPKGVGLNYFGNECLALESVAYNQVFYPTLMQAKSDVLIPYFKYVFGKSIESLKGANLEVEYAIFVDSPSSYEIKRSVFQAVAKEFQEFANAKPIFSSRKELLDLSLINEINRVGKIEEERLLVLDINNFEYQASMFDYHKGEKTPVRSYSITKTYKNPDKFAIGSYGFVDEMIRHATERQAAEVRGKLYEEKITLERYQLMALIEERISKESDYFYRNPESELVFQMKVNKSIYSVIINKSDYDAALQQIVYSKLDSIRLFLKNVKEDVGLTSYKIIYYGTGTRYTDTKAIIYSVFRSQDVIPYNMVFVQSPSEILDLNHTAQGAALQSSLRFKGYIPKVSYKNYRDRGITLMTDSDSLLLSQTDNGTSFYALNLDLQIPLEINMNPEQQQENPMIVYIDSKEINLVSQLYERSTLKADKNYDRRFQKFIANLRLGVKEEKNKSIVVFELSCLENNYHNEFTVEVE